ncbi:hypothetical protein GL218_08244 [Daldinia childiae]|uniref:uncharacterized protein n=1 Tax=Daldinia childiae TaxID=326645 RepID=UPI001445FEF1|nr:uncharacterized protein GL218_08244 [Daldinia childiae]KAF3068946.1 hypothetical protein GL218_08244 [Daldinia childiae]
MELSIAEVIHKDNEAKGKATARTEADGEPQYEWLLAKLAMEQHPPETAAASSSSSTLYQREYAMYLEIFKANIAKKGINVVQAESVFQTPIWSGGNILFLNYNSSSASSALSTNDSTQGATRGSYEDSEPDVYQGFNLDKYLFELNFYYYRYKDWFRCMVDSFWGPQVVSVFEITHSNRPFIQIAFKRDWNFAVERKQYYDNVMMFLHIMARLRPLEGLGPFTDIFGFSLVTFTAKIITQFETVERLGINRPEGIQPMKFIIRHRFEAWRSIVVNIKD